VQLASAAVGIELPSSDLQERGLAGSVRSDQRCPLARAEVERYAREHWLGAVVFDDVAEGKEDHERISASSKFQVQRSKLSSQAAV
jgi:hypothetical protein